MKTPYIQNGKIKCLECGKYFKKPLSHAWQKHQILARNYKEKHSLDVKRGIVTEEYRDKMRSHVIANGTLKNLQKGAKYRFTKGRNHNYKRSAQTMARLKLHWGKISRLGKGPPTIQKIKIKCALCNKPKLIYPRQYKLNNNYCGISCRNKRNNIIRQNKST